VIKLGEGREGEPIKGGGEREGWTEGEGRKELGTEGADLPSARRTAKGTT
jgi:hypothetical protein